jgi:hypothetical protein
MVVLMLWAGHLNRELDRQIEQTRALRAEVEKMQARIEAWQKYRPGPTLTPAQQATASPSVGAGRSETRPGKSSETKKAK